MNFVHCLCTKKEEETQRVFCVCFPPQILCFFCFFLLFFSTPTIIYILLGNLRMIEILCIFFILKPNFSLRPTISSTFVIFFIFLANKSAPGKSGILRGGSRQPGSVEAPRSSVLKAQKSYFPLFSAPAGYPWPKRVAQQGLIHRGGDLGWATL